MLTVVIPTGAVGGSTLQVVIPPYVPAGGGGGGGDGGRPSINRQQSYHVDTKPQRRDWEWQDSDGNWQRFTEKIAKSALDAGGQEKMHVLEGGVIGARLSWSRY